MSSGPVAAGARVLAIVPGLDERASIGVVVGQLLCTGATVVVLVPATWWDGVAGLVGIKGGAPVLFLVLAVFGLLGLVLQLSLSMSGTERRLVDVTVRNAVTAWLHEHPDELGGRAGDGS